MSLSKEDIEATGMVTDESGMVMCPECKRGLRFNSGNPAVYHAKDCSKGENGPTYVGSGQRRFYGTITPEGKIKITGEG